MQHIDLIPANQLGSRYGTKTLIYSGPGVGKTPTLATAPAPVICSCEPGHMSIRRTTLPVFEAYTPAKIRDFFAWLNQSREARNFSTICIDSVSEMAETILDEKLGGKSKSGNKVDGKAAYGDMAREVYGILKDLYFLQGPNIVLLAKQDDKPDDGSGKKRPYFPGKDLNVKVPHLYDVILHLENVPLPTGGTAKGFRTADSYEAVARDRSGFLAELEPADLSYVFNKIAQGFANG